MTDNDSNILYKEEDLINYYIGSCISADLNIVKEDIENNINSLKLIKEKFIDKLTEIQLKFINNGIELLTEELTNGSNKNVRDSEI